MPRRLAPLVVSAALLAAGCGSTVIDTSVSTTVAGVATTTTAVAVPDGLDAQLNQVVTLASGLGDQIVDEGSRAEEDSLQDLVTIWETARPAVAGDEPVLAREFDHQLDLISRAVDKHRPADADKASSILRQLVATYLDRHGS